MCHTAACRGAVVSGIKRLLSYGSLEDTACPIHCILNTDIQIMDPEDVNRALLQWST